MRWKATEWLGGKAGKDWKAARAKVYPERLCKVLAFCHIDYANTIPCEGEEALPDHLMPIISTLSGIRGPHDEMADGMIMRHNFCGGSAE